MNKYDHHATGKTIRSKTLIEIWKCFKDTPREIFIKRDFHKEYEVTAKYINILLKMGLIEKVDLKYKTGKRYRTFRNVKGYKIKTSNNKKIKETQ